MWRNMEAVKLRDFMSVIKALADENRARILLALGGRELCVCQIVELLGLAPSTVSKHMSILKQARLVDGRKQGAGCTIGLRKPMCPPKPKEFPNWYADCFPTILRSGRTASAWNKSSESIRRSCETTEPMLKKKGKHPHG